MFTLIENGEVYAPEPMGRNSVLLSDGTILKIGEVDARALDQLEIPVESGMSAERKPRKRFCWSSLLKGAFSQDYRIRHDLHVNPANPVIL